jgi:hypothetical protein
LHKRAVDIQVDGGITWSHIPAICSAGATSIVAGTHTLFEAGVDLGEAAHRPPESLLIAASHVANVHNLAMSHLSLRVPQGSLNPVRSNDVVCSM